jgi:hypothetical protein
MDGMWTESNEVAGKTWDSWKTAVSTDDASYCRISPSGYPSFPLAMCKIARLSFVAGAELPKKYILA